MSTLLVRIFCLLLLAPSLSHASAAARRGGAARAPVLSISTAAPPAQGGSPWSRLRKPLHQFVPCFGLVLGVTGVFLAFASGPLVPIAAWAVAAVAWQVCGG